MSIQSEISRLKNNVSDSLDALAEQGVNVPATANSDNLPELIRETGNKVNVSDIVDNLTTADAEKPLSAKQGVVIVEAINAARQECLDEVDALSDSILNASGVVKGDVLPKASATTEGITLVYPAAQCTTYTSDVGTVSPLAVQKGAKMFAITRPPKKGSGEGETGVTVNAIPRWEDSTGDLKNSKIIIEDVTNSRDSSKKAQVITIPAEGGKKMVYGYCTDQVDGTSFIGGLFSADATSYPYQGGLAIGGSSGNLLWKGDKVLTSPDLNGYATQNWVATEISKAELGGSEATEEAIRELMSNYYDKTSTDSQISSAINTFIGAYITSDGGAIDKLQEIADWIDSDEDGVADILITIDGKADKTDLNEYVKEESILNENGVIKQRVLPEGYPYITTGTILPETNLVFDEDVGSVITDNFQIAPGYTYVVTWNGIEYECVAEDINFEGLPCIALGDTGMFRGEEPNGALPFIILKIDEAYIEFIGGYGGVFSLDGSMEASISIDGSIVHKIDKAFLPDINTLKNLVDGSIPGSVRASGTTIENDDYAMGVYATAFGYNTKASGDNSYAEGYETTASGSASHAEGSKTIASGDCSHAEGSETSASGWASHAEGSNTTASVSSAHAEGHNTTASEWASHAEGESTVASSRCSHAEGMGTISSYIAQHAQGKYNIEDKNNKYAHIVGNGSSDTARSNAHTLDWDGNAWFQGEVKIGGIGWDDENAKTLATTEQIDAINNIIGTNDSLLGTWVLNDEIDTSTLLEYEEVSFVSNGRQYMAISYTTVGPSSWGIKALYFCYKQESGTIANDLVFTNNPSGSQGIYHGWSDERYKTIEILEDPTDEAFIAWLKNNATKQSETIFDRLNDLKSITSQTPITYPELVALRDTSKLIPGMFYRITDYVCTTTQENTRAMNHQFDIIVQALSENTLSENAKADFHEGDTYFASCKVDAWELKYCLDNDTSRFAWADDSDEQKIINLNSLYSNGAPLVRQPSFDGRLTAVELEEYYYAWGTQADVDDADSTNFIYSKGETLVDGEEVYNLFEGELQIANVSSGKGVIYYMKDEYNNECPYDFKNIQFKRAISLENGYPEYDPENGEETWVYTFCGNSYHVDNDEWSELKDGSLESPYGHQNDESFTTFCNNIIKKYIKLYDDENEDNTKCGKQYLNDNVFLGYWIELNSSSNFTYYKAYCCHNNTFGYNCYKNTFGNKCHSNIYGDYCSFNIFSNECCFNVFGNKCYSNIFGNYCESNIFGNYCEINAFGNICRSNTFGNYCSGNIFGNTYEHNALGDLCTGNIFGDYCRSNTLSVSCYSNTFDNNCNENIFGDNCGFNTLGNSCESNTFGAHCNKNTFGDYCNLNTFGNGCGSNTFDDTCNYNRLGNSCCDNTFSEYCYFNAFSNDCNGNTFGKNCGSNTFGNSCHSNIFGNMYKSNRFGHYCGDNTFGENCGNNRFGNYCSENIFGDNCYFNIFGNNCVNNIFGNNLHNYNFETFINITYSYLKVLRDNSELTPGQFYRITDYQCTTVQDDTRAMNNQFDIIVQALSNNTLSEIAKADYHWENGKPDGYFMKSTGDQTLNIELCHTLLKAGYAPSDYTFAEFGEEENGDGELTYVLYRELEDEETGEIAIDYLDRFFYVDNYEFGGELCSRWRLIEDGTAENGNYVWDSPYKKYILTNLTIEDDEIIIEPSDVEILYMIYDDDEGTYIGGGKSEDTFVEASYKENNEGIVVPVLYKTKLEEYPETDYGDTFYYVGRYDYHGETYDRWRKIEDNGLSWDSSDYRYILTNIVIEDNRFMDDVIEEEVDELVKVANIPAWEIKYCLDNDTTRFAWADEENGKGVIYWMKDEYNNECPYDFKNIQFVRYLSFNGGYPELDEDNGDETWVYTFCGNENNEHDEWSELKDGSLESPYGHQHDDADDLVSFSDNIIKPFISGYDSNDEDPTKTGIMHLNNIVMLGYWDKRSLSQGSYSYFHGCKANTFGYNCYDITLSRYCKFNTFGNYCRFNTFGNNCQSNTFGNGCHSNTFGSGCHSNTFGNSCPNNTFGNYCMSNTFGNYCRFNTFGNNCQSNTFGNSCNFNEFSNECHDNAFDNECRDNKFGYGCHDNTFDNFCENNTFGYNCFYNTFGYDCLSNTFGEVCSSNIFNDSCYSNTFGNDCDSNTFGSNCENNTFGDNCYRNAFGDSFGDNTFNDGCYNNTFGYGCSSNTFGDNCKSNNFGNECKSNTFGDACNSNTFGNYCQSNTFGDECNYNEFDNSCKNNSFAEDCRSNTFGQGCTQNTFSYQCSYNEFGDNFQSNVIGNECSYNEFGGNCQFNTFGNECFSNTFANACYSNTFGDNCSNNTFGSTCSYNEFGDYCSSNTFANNCNNNTFGDYCSTNTFGYSGYSNTLGNRCYDNTFGYSCQSNTFGDYCNNNTFGDYCSTNTFGTSCTYTIFGNYCGHNAFVNKCNENTFGNRCSYIKLVTEDPDTNQVQKVVVSEGVKGTFTNYRELQVSRGAAPVVFEAANTTHIILD